MYKITNNLLDINPNQYLMPGLSQTRSNHPHKYREISTSHNYYKYSFLPRTIAQRNKLPSLSPTTWTPSVVHYRILTCQLHPSGISHRQQHHHPVLHHTRPYYTPPSPSLTYTFPIHANIPKHKHPYPTSS